MNNLLYLNVPYSEKEEAKKLGAKWNPEKKKWYYNGNPANYVKFAKWLFNIEKQAEITILMDSIYIIEAKRICWKCKKETTVVGIAAEKFITIYDTECDDDNGNPIYNSEIIGFDDTTKGLYITWSDEEKDFPDFLLKYLKENYNVKTGFSSVVGKTFANFCEHCNALQGNNFLFHEVDSPFDLMECSLEGNIEKVKNLKIKKIKLENNIPIDFSFGFSGEEYLYLKYGNIEEIKL